MARMEKTRARGWLLLATLDAVDGVSKVLEPHGLLAFLGTSHKSPWYFRSSIGAGDAAFAWLGLATVARSVCVALVAQL